MSKKTNILYEQQIRQYLSRTPYYCMGYMESLGKRTPATRFAYLFDVIQLMEYVQENRPEIKAMTMGNISKIPGAVFDEIRAEEIDGWLDSLVTKDRVTGLKKQASPAYINRKIAAIKRFYEYLNATRIAKTNPLSGIDRREPDHQEFTLLSDEDIKRLIDGIDQNRLFLVCGKDVYGHPVREVKAITDTVRLIREAQVTRNIAIISLMIYAGLTPLEISSLNLESMDYVNGCIHYTGRDGASRTAPLAEEISARLARYLHGPRIPQELLERQTDPDRKDFVMFCRKHMTDKDIRKKAATRFRRDDDQFLDDVSECASVLRSQGRDAFSPEPWQKALFLSSQGGRLSVRMIQQMVIDMTRTYLPDLCTDRNLNPGMLRGVRLASAEEPELMQQFGYGKQYAKRLKQQKNSEILGYA